MVCLSLILRISLYSNYFAVFSMSKNRELPLTIRLLLRTKQLMDNKTW